MSVQSITRSAFLLLILSGPYEARAHHPISENHFDHARVQSFVGVDAAAGGFDVGGVRGSHLSLMPKVNLEIGEKWEAAFRLPVHHLRTNGRDPVTGIGDADLAFKRSLWREEGRWVSAGLNAEIPTGSSSQRLGAGHVELAPFVAGVATSGPTMFHGTLGVLFSPFSHSHSATAASLVSPHADSELQYHAGTLVPFGERYYGNLILGGFTALSHSPTFSGSTYYTAIQGGARLGPETRIILGPQIPFGGQRRFEWKATLSLEFLLGTDPSDRRGHESHVMR